MLYGGIEGSKGGKITPNSDIFIMKIGTSKLQLRLLHLNLFEMFLALVTDSEPIRSISCFLWELLWDSPETQDLSVNQLIVFNLNKISIL